MRRRSCGRRPDAGGSPCYAGVMVALAKLPVRMSVAEFLAWAAVRDGRWQLVDGAPQAMAPPSSTHGAIQGRPHARSAITCWRRAAPAASRSPPSGAPRISGEICRTPADQPAPPWCPAPEMPTHFRDQQATENKDLMSRCMLTVFVNRDTRWAAASTVRRERRFQAFLRCSAGGIAY